MIKVIPFFSIFLAEIRYLSFFFIFSLFLILTKYSPSEWFYLFFFFLNFEDSGFKLYIFLGGVKYDIIIRLCLQLLNGSTSTSYQKLQIRANIQEEMLEVRQSKALFHMLMSRQPSYTFACRMIDVIVLSKLEVGTSHFRKEVNCF